MEQSWWLQMQKQCEPQPIQQARDEVEHRCRGCVEAISWTIPSARFVLQENTDLSSPKLDGRSGIAGGDEFAIPSHSAHTCRKSLLQTKV
jgi:hypothetical protein